MSECTPISTPRIARLRELATRIVEVEQTPDYDEDELAAVMDEVHVVAEEVWAQPVNGPNDILERTLVAHHFVAQFVGEGGKHVLARFEEGESMDERAVDYLIDVILVLAKAPEGRSTHVQA
jgi:hypothetical protein